MKYITKTIWVLSLISLFTDMASEMLYPVLPMYLQSLGFSIVLIGVFEGFAEALTGLSKGYFGKWSDNIGKRVPFVQAGYGLSGIARPLMVLFANPFWVFFMRSIDRLGKGIRTAARDALISDESTEANKAKVFGFHRSLDTLGAVLGPGIALIYLHYYPGDYKNLFLIAFIPGLLAILSSGLIKESKQTHLANNHEKIKLAGFFDFWKNSSRNYKSLVIGLLSFSLINSSDVFLLLKAKEFGVNDSYVIGLFMFYNLIYAFFSFPLGILADKIGLKIIFLFGLFIFAFTYFGMAFFTGNKLLIFLFFVYGLYAAATEGIGKAWISNLTTRSQMATALGTFTSLQSIATLISSTAAGLIWYSFGADALFIYTGIGTCLVIGYFAWWVPAAKA